jgi:hypothetical protein
VTCCGQTHIKTLARTIVLIKGFFFVFLLLSTWIVTDISELVKVAILLAFGLALTSYGILIMGIQTYRFHLLIPYFFISFILILVGMLLLF